MVPSQRTIPTLVYDDIEAAHGFLVEAFGVSPGRLERDGADEGVHGEVQVGSDAIWLHRVAPEHELASARSLTAASGGVVIMVDDVDRHRERARPRRPGGLRADRPALWPARVRGARSRRGVGSSKGG